jgi:hypothetical protein
MSTQYRLVQSGKTASGGCSAGQGSSEPVAPRISILMVLKPFWHCYPIELATKAINTRFLNNKHEKKENTKEYNHILCS